MKKYLIHSAAAALAFAAIISVGAVQHAFAAAPVTCTMTVSPSTIPSGASTLVTVKWTTAGAHKNGVIADFLGGNRPKSGSRVIMVSTAQRWDLYAFSNSILANSVGNYAHCVVTVSTSGNSMPL